MQKIDDKPTNIAKEAFGLGREVLGLGIAIVSGLATKPRETICALGALAFIIHQETMREVDEQTNPFLTSEEPVIQVVNPKEK